MKKIKLSDKNIFIFICTVIAAAIIIMGVNINSKLHKIHTVPAVVIHDVSEKATTEAESGKTVYITPSGKKYHRENCEHLHSKGIEIAVNRAIELNYDACSKCQP